MERCNRDSTYMHICQEQFSMLPGMREFYDTLRIIPTSEVGDIALIRSHIAYWCGSQKAEKASIKPSRGHSYRVAMYGQHDKHDAIVKIRNYFDHREGIVGLR